MKAYLYIGACLAMMLAACSSSGTKDNYNDHAVPDGDLPISTGSQDTTMVHPADSAAVKDSTKY